MTDATMTVDHESADTVRIALAGEIDMDNARQVEQGITGAIGNQLTAVTLDLSGLDPQTTRSIEVRLKGYRPVRRTLDWSQETEKRLVFELEP